MADTSKITRRTALGLIGSGGIITAGETFGFTSVTGTRGVSVNTSEDSDALIGLLTNDQIQKNQQEKLVSVTNNTDEMINVTVSLSDCSHGTLYGPDGTSGCSVDFSLDPVGTDGDSGTVDIEAADDGITIPFTITATSPTLSFEGIRSTEAVSGNAESAVEITTVKQFRANKNDNDWTIREVEAVSNDENHELEYVEYEVRSNAGNGDLVGTHEESASGDQYLRTGTNNDPAIVITPDEDHQIEQQDEYELTITIYDDGSNFDSTSETAKA